MFIDVYNACYNIFLHGLPIYRFQFKYYTKNYKKSYQGQNLLMFLSKIIKYYKILRPTCIPNSNL